MLRKHGIAVKWFLRQYKPQVTPFPVLTRVDSDTALWAKRSKFRLVVTAHEVEFFNEYPTESKGAPGFDSVDDGIAVRDQDIRLDVGQKQVGLAVLEAFL